MKVLPLFLLMFFSQTVVAQSLDYISVRKKNGRVVKNFYAGSTVLLQTTNGDYIQGSIETIKLDTVYVRLYDIRFYRTSIGSVSKDTITTSVIGIYFRDISRIYLDQRKGFFQRNTGPLLMLGGAGYLTLNVLNGALFHQPITDKKNLEILGFSAGTFGFGYLFQKLFVSGGFSKKKHQLIYVDL